MAKALDYVRQIRKTPIVVNDARFFYANRCIIPYINEGMRMVGEGVSPALVEGAAKKAEAVAERRGYVTSRELFQAGAEHAAECGVHGSSTFCVFSLLPYEGLKEYLTGKNRINHHILNSATSMSYLGRTDVDDVVELFATENMVAQCTNLGDSGVLVGRPSTREVFLRTPQQEHSFGYPFQLGHEDHADEKT